MDVRDARRRQSAVARRVGDAIGLRLTQCALTDDLGDLLAVPT